MILDDKILPGMLSNVDFIILSYIINKWMFPTTVSMKLSRFNDGSPVNVKPCLHGKLVRGCF